MLDIVIATRNRHKFRELTALLAAPGIRWQSLAERPDVRPAAERGRTFDANAIAKARTIAKATGRLALADDSGLRVDTLRGAPGIRSARFAGAPGSDGANTAKLLRVLAAHPRSRRRAHYHCSLALASPTRLLGLTRGRWRGRIAPRPAGSEGFGYDPVFLVPRLGKTVGQIPARVKQRLSHRAQAARRLRPVLRRVVAEARRHATRRART